MLVVDIKASLGHFQLAVRFSAPASGITVLLGPSGAGKSTTLAMLVGTRRPDSGHITLKGQVLFDSNNGISLPVAKRHVGLVHQDGLLFPHMSVKANLCYGLKYARRPHPAGLDAVVSVLQIGGLLERRPRHLSGGERQRVALGRAILAQPDFLLLDEPVSALDHALRQETLQFILRLNREFHLPMLLVTHAVAEARALADHVLLLEDGVIKAEGTPAALLPFPLAGTILRHEGERTLVKFNEDSFWLPRLAAAVGTVINLSPAFHPGKGAPK